MGSRDVALAWSRPRLLGLAVLSRGTEVADALKALTAAAADAVVDVIAELVAERLERAFLSIEVGR